PLVDVVAGDAAPLRDALGGGELVGQIDVPRLRAPVAVRAGVRAQPDAAHRLDAARDADVDRPGGDQPGDQMVGLLAAAALTVDGGGADLLRQTRGQPRRPGDVVGLLGELRDAAPDELFDVAGADARLLDERLLDRAQELGRVEAGQPSTALADWAASGFNDDRVTHSAR